MNENEKKPSYSFNDFFDIDEIQKIQDLFAKSTGVASIITTPEGVPITKESGFSTFCTKVRNTEKGLCNCMKSDSMLGSPKIDGPRIQKCVSGGLYDGGASIMVGVHHIANWLIGQVIDDAIDPEKIIKYAKKVGLTDDDIRNDVAKITRMSLDQFADVCNFLYYNARLLSKMGHDNLLLRQEIKKRTLMEKNLKKEEQQFRVTLASVGEGIITTDKEGSITYMNKVAEDITRWSYEKAKGVSINKIVIMVDEHIGTKAKKTKNHKFSYNELILKDGTKKPIENSIAPIKDINGQIQGKVMVIRDLTEERKLQRELQEKELKHRTMISNISDVITVIDEYGIVKYQSENVSMIFGWKVRDIMGALAIKMIHPSDVKIAIEAYKKILSQPKTGMDSKFRILCKDKKYKYIHIHGINLLNDPVINGVLLNYRDITETVQLEKDKEAAEAWLRNQQKLDSLGTLAGGVAHEINNPINGIMNYSQLIIDEVQNKDNIYEYAQEILHETKRVSNIVKNLLQFSRQETKRISSVNPRKIVEDTLSLIKTIIKQDQISLEVNIQKDIPNIKCRSQQIQQVLMNLMTNARDALNDRYKGYDDDKKLIVSCNVIDIKNKKWVRLMVCDHGRGIKKSIQNKIYDPFFTTKGRAEGTGIGLSISYRIVEENKGKLTFETKQGKYTKFYLDLPIDKI